MHQYSLGNLPVNILHGLDPGNLGHDLGLPHYCPSWLGRGWAGPSIANVLGLTHLLAWASPIGMPMQLSRHAQAGESSFLHALT